MADVALQIAGERRGGLVSGAGRVGFAYGNEWISALFHTEPAQRGERFKCERQRFKLRNYLYDLGEGEFLQTQEAQAIKEKTD